jgi:hypothetical protein
MREMFFNKIDANNIDDEIRMYGESIKQRLDIPVADFTPEDSKFFKFTLPEHRNKGVQDREYQ